MLEKEKSYTLDAGKPKKLTDVLIGIGAGASIGVVISLCVYILIIWTQAGNEG